MKEERESSDIGNDDKNIENEAYKHEPELGGEEEWMEYKQPHDLVDVRDESVYESLIEKMPSCSLNFDFRIEKGDPSNLKISCMIGCKFIANAHIDLDLPMNVMSLAYYNTIRSQGYEHRGLNFLGIGMDMHVFIGNMSYLILDREKGLITFTDEIREVTFKTPYKDPKMDDLTSEGHDLLSSRVLLSDDEVRRGCESVLDLENRFYKDIDKLGPSLMSTWMTFGGNTRNLGSFRKETDKITDLHQIHEEVLFIERGDGITGIKRRHCDLSSDGFKDLVTASGRGRLKEDLESST
ncbi:hypothetical protein Tco_1139985 [Tanacetum coccineum]